MEQGHIGQATKEAGATKAAMAKRIADMKANMGMRATPGDDGNISMEE